MVMVCIFVCFCFLCLLCTCSIYAFSSNVFTSCYKNVALYYTISVLIFTKHGSVVAILNQLLIAVAYFMWNVVHCPNEHDKCPICSRSMLSHARKVKCFICCYYYHMKCISLDPNDLSYIELNRTSWYCCNCITAIFPFNHIENNELFISEVNSMDFELKTIEDLSTKLFNPFEINNDDIYYPLCDIDPDAHYFNKLNAHISQNCNYYYEH